MLKVLKKGHSKKSMAYFLEGELVYLHSLYNYKGLKFFFCCKQLKVCSDVKQLILHQYRPFT